MACKGDDEQTNSYLVFAAIDFGTTYSGYGFTFKKDIQSKSGRAYTSFFGGLSVREKTVKAPTLLLLNSKKEFDSFGFEAEDNFLALEKTERDGYYYFERFKMKLYETKNLGRESIIKDHMKRDHKALEIFSIAIKHLKTSLIEDLSKKIDDIRESDINWSITVPAIWSDAAKQFMREAANLAGLRNEHLRLILEPEAASAFVNSTSLCTIVTTEDQRSIEPFPVKTKYIVADLGGGTADLAVHEVLEGRKLREITRSDGGAFGGQMVNQAFEDFLEEVFGKEIIEYLDEHCTEKFIEMKNDFETKKRYFSTDTQRPLIIQFPYIDLQELLGEAYPLKVNEIHTKFDGKIKFFRDKMELRPDLVESWFLQAVDGIIEIISNLQCLESDSGVSVNFLVMVGGFTDSPFVQNKIKENFLDTEINVLIPIDASLAVLKGAIVFGNTPMIITERIARYSYGFSNCAKFDPAKHPESLKFNDKGLELCRSVFCQVIKKGQILKVGDTYSEEVVHYCSSILELFIPIITTVYRSDDEEPKFTLQEYGCIPVGTIIGFPPSGGWPPLSIIHETLVVGESEFTVVVKDTVKDYVMKSKLDFLGKNETTISDGNACTII